MYVTVQSGKINGCDIPFVLKTLDVYLWIFRKQVIILSSLCDARSSLEEVAGLCQSKEHCVKVDIILSVRHFICH